MPLNINQGSLYRPVHTGNIPKSHTAQLQNKEVYSITVRYLSNAETRNLVVPCLDEEFDIRIQICVYRFPCRDVF